MNRKIYLIMLIPLLLLLTSCGDSTEPFENNDNVPQKDIFWPSLANTSWPMYHHDPQSTGRSKYRGPQSGVVINKLEFGIGYTGPAIGYNNLFFVGNGDPPAFFYAYDYNGNKKWTSRFICQSTPLVSSDSIIYSLGRSELFGFSHKGDTIVKKRLDKSAGGVGINIDKEGNLYYVDDTSTLVVRDKKGDKIWELKDERFSGNSSNAPTFSPDGKTIYLPGNSASVLAVDIVNKNIKWGYGDAPLYSSPAVDNAGNLYFLPAKSGVGLPQQLRIKSINKHGQINWEYSIGTNKIASNIEPTIDYNGNIYFAAVDTVYSFTNGGKPRWKKPLNGFVNNTPLICDVDNTIYVGVTSKQIQANKIIAIRDNGEIKWELIDTQVRAFAPGVALTENGLLICPPWDDPRSPILIIK